MDLKFSREKHNADASASGRRSVESSEQIIRIVISELSIKRPKEVSYHGLPRAFAPLPKDEMTSTAIRKFYLHAVRSQKTLSPSETAKAFTIVAVHSDDNYSYRRNGRRQTPPKIVSISALIFS
jgi:hypothetical protein